MKERTGQAVCAARAQDREGEEAPWQHRETGCPGRDDDLEEWHGGRRDNQVLCGTSRAPLWLYSSSFYPWQINEGKSSGSTVLVMNVALAY